MKDRLIWILAQLQALQDNYAIRSEGETVFLSAKNELADVIQTYTEAVAPPPAIEYKAMTGDEISDLKIAISADVRALVRADLDETKAGIVSAIGAESQQSDVTVLDAIAQSRADVLAAMPAAA
jgi:hypothetical protein